jgi:predicted nuclease with TOPRIM domain
MENIYNFKYFAETYNTTKEYYIEELHDMLKTLGEFYDKIEGHMINLAIRDKWKEWNDTMKEGDTFNFSDEMLANTGDKNIDDLYVLYENVYNIIELISKRNKIGFEGKYGGKGNAE